MLISSCVAVSCLSAEIREDYGYSLLLCSPGPAKPVPFLVVRKVGPRESPRRPTPAACGPCYWATAPSRRAAWQVFRLVRQTQASGEGRAASSVKAAAAEPPMRRSGAGGLEDAELWPPGQAPTLTVVPALRVKRRRRRWSRTPVP